MCVLVYAQNLAVAQGINRIEASIDLDPTSPPAPPVMGRYEDAVPRVDVLLGGDLEFFRASLQCSKLSRISSRPYDGPSSEGFITKSGSKIASASARSPRP